MKKSLPLPSRLTTDENNVRRVGVEIEFTNLDPIQVVEEIIAIWGGSHQIKNPFVHHVKDTSRGDFVVELDSSLLNSQKYVTLMQKMGVDPKSLPLGENLEELLSDVASWVVPYEMVSPPLPLDSLGEIEELRERLRLRRALGSKSALRYAFGLHFNPELASLEPDYIRDSLRSFLVLYPWIFKNSHIDFSRRVTPYIDEFPADYIKLVLDQQYEPPLDKLIRDYMQHNPTRNRPLDMLPLFMYLHPEIVEAYPIEKGLTQGRPTFHYRLPNSLIDDPNWSIAREWSYWVQVERLVEEPQKLRSMAAELLELMEKTFSVIQWQWPARVDDWLK
ncbi:amidoligase family protein [Desulfurispira natronophila]|uniref:Amidoligase enzyme n=1 Tax=Desulfurispira natronophila TaxID=682562 RepID=A0A7W8DFX7_9BACT|nr:amidoligase family protein [Desulfurispira natronophila]MBB5020805.1 hypothetical protein [Desulfurispira natronophila]